VTRALRLSTPWLSTAPSYCKQARIVNRNDNRRGRFGRWCLVFEHILDCGGSIKDRALPFVASEIVFE
jgi:hypothetical protein